MGRKTGPKPKQLVETTYIGLPVGRNNVVIDPEDVRKLAEIGCRDQDIANFLGIQRDTLIRNFSDSLLLGREQMKVVLRTAMLKNAVEKNNAVMQIFLAKNLLGMSDSPTESEDHKPLPWNDEI
jgi:hypothetical protein